ncbi:hypothetical protein A2U01_0060154 [Trifolium medium]|uniref:Uncharacterized protein n=1 Tax=Trifolium medium TaxID=97028 RepID=A0A392RTJ8_9FABA|nr:hypothetical protein [Trifolium medium]
MGVEWMSHRGILGCFEVFLGIGVEYVLKSQLPKSESTLQWALGAKGIDRFKSPGFTHCQWCGAQ